MGKKDVPEVKKRKPLQVNFRWVNAVYDKFVLLEPQAHLAHKPCVKNVFRAIKAGIKSERSIAEFAGIPPDMMRHYLHTYKDEPYATFQEVYHKAKQHFRYSMQLKLLDSLEGRPELMLRYLERTEPQDFRETKDINLNRQR